MRSEDGQLTLGQVTNTLVEWCGSLCAGLRGHLDPDASQPLTFLDPLFEGEPQVDVGPAL
jgi:hypothetical protein